MERKGGNRSELSVITKAKDLCRYILTVTEKSPKRFRFTLTSRIQNHALNIIENLYRANEVFLAKDDMRVNKPGVTGNLRKTAVWSTVSG